MSRSSNVAKNKNFLDLQTLLTARLHYSSIHVRSIQLDPGSVVELRLH